MAAALRQEQLDSDQLKFMRLDQVYKIASASGVAALCSFALPERRGSWRDAYYTSLRRAVLFGNERKEIIAELDQAGIWSAPLKGSVLAELYPEFGMREMVDNDILVDAEHIDEVGEMMLARGYTRISGYGIGVDDEYHKEPVYNFEMHRYLFAKDRVPLLGEYFADFSNMLEAKGDSPLHLTMKPEHLYLYILAHAWRHYSQRGTGLRILSDVCVLLKHYQDTLDWDRVLADANTLGICDFEKLVRGVALKMLAGELSIDALSDEECRLVERMSADGFYGSYENHVEHLLDEAEQKGWSKLHYLASRVFPSKDWYKTHYPFAYEHAWARPAALVRFWAYVLKNPYEREKIPVELRALFRKH